MSNNKDVEYDGDSYFFVMQDSRTVRDVRKDSQVNMALQSRMGLFGAPPLFISIEGTAEVILDKDMLRAHWRPTCSMPTTRARFMLRA